MTRSARQAKLVTSVVSDYIRQHHLGLIAIFIAITGTAYASNQLPAKPPDPVASSAKVKRGPRGPQGLQGPQGPQGQPGQPGQPGQDGSPDSASDVLTKLLTVDGGGSGLDADLLDGLSSNAFLPAGGTAVNADKLDNLDSTDIGLGYFTGRINNLSTTAPKGTTGNAPSGVGTATTTTTLDLQNMTLSPDRTIVVRRLAVTLTQPVACDAGICGAGAEQAIVHLESFAPGATSPTTSLNCAMNFDQSTCGTNAAAGPIVARSLLRVSITTTGDVGFAAGTDALFSWQAAAS
jgi:hypothetical protein